MIPLSVIPATIVSTAVRARIPRYTPATMGDYEINVTDGAGSVKDLNTADGDDGYDKLENIEFISASDKTTQHGDVEPTNVAPVASNDYYALNEDGTLTFNAIDN